MEEEPENAMRGEPAQSRLSITAGLSLPLSGYASRMMDSGTGDNGYRFSKAVMVLDLIWNLSFVVASALVLLFAVRERPSTPLRAWLFGYSLQCVFHVSFSCLRYRSKDHDDDLAGVARVSSFNCRNSILERLESLNTILSSFWWVIGFYWIVIGGKELLLESPRLYWSTVIFMAFDVLLIVFCIGMVSIMFFVFFCCMPIIAMACGISTRQGASEDEIKGLPKYIYHKSSLIRIQDDYSEEENYRTSSERGSKRLDGEFTLLPVDSDCCICLSQYSEGADLNILPCKHHFHSGCICKWLRINATCPLCKLNIQRGDTLV